MTIKKANPIKASDYLRVDDQSFLDTCMGQCLERVVNQSKEKRILRDDIRILRSYLASATLCLADLHRDRDGQLHHDDDMANALTLLHSVSSLVSWFEESDATFAYILDNPELAKNMAR